MKPFSSIQNQGYKAHKKGKSISDNPYIYTSRNQQGLMKEAAWAKGWNDAEKEGNQHLEDQKKSD